MPDRDEGAGSPLTRVSGAGVDEFEAYVRKLGYAGVQRFGQELITGKASYDTAESSGLVPADYVVGTDDELQIALWGSVDADLRVMVDRSGRISIPRVGTIMVAGVRYGDLTEVISRRVGQVFRNYQISVSLGQIRSVRVYLTGYVKRPGVYTVGGLSSVVNALMRSGGPASAGSLRSIELRRGKDTITRYDLYDLLLKGDRSADRVVQNGDVIHVGPIGPQVALVGSVNRPAIFEMKPGEKVADIVAMAGGFTAVADRHRLAIERLDDRSKTRITQLSLPEDSAQAPGSGDVLRAFSAVEATQPVARQNKRVRIEGEVLKPGEYVLPPGVTTRMAVGLAGGLTPNAYVYGTELTRESVRVAQQQSYDRALRDMETEFARASATQRAISADEAATFEQRSTATSRLIEKLRQVRPTGRIVLQLEPDASTIPDLPIEDGDRVYVPARPTTVSVFGSVFNSGAFLLESGRTVGDVLNLAGGPTRGSDPGSTFVLRPNGSVLSQLQRSSFFGLVGGVTKLKAEPGDTVFVPEMMNKTTWTQDLKEWTQIMYQFGIGAAALKTLQN
ncbi:SLBB domain-containing protein [Sphaerotilus montanus]|uniref:Protein involved in polysaccharide export with SLBB domain n=1 Tax=Sphaerotilus montanus TaxID=522889 RepID=A0A7Y9QUY9_9BURK|nr:SLBB domain-containing protein [Sphaerotilus montanus]NYG31867.1 protein involved in polysaccharide export with SLBB domain [Sphaerotilus montanus]NZD57325.1 SLBB domain-containing protein [Sphaerotilus montanus]